ncbi:MAG: alpha/beta hydrolase family protein, partial [Janthinobacterium lividum]
GGLVVLTYDKRREGCSVLTRDDDRLAVDALRALDVVARQPGVDRERLGLLGFSEGGWVVPLAAERSPYRVPLAGEPEPARVAFTILVSAPVVSPVDQTAWSVDRRTASAPDVVRSGVATLLGMGRPVIGDLGTDVRPALAATNQPVYAVWGGADSSVPVRVAAERLRSATGLRSRMEIVGGVGHRVPLASGWAERASDWVRRGFPEDPVVRGAQPDTLVGLPILPRRTLLGDPRLHLALAALAALVAAGCPLRRQGSAPKVRTSRRG